jgi:hypothetical protein
MFLISYNKDTIIRLPAIRSSAGRRVPQDFQSLSYNQKPLFS